MSNSKILGAIFFAALPLSFYGVGCSSSSGGGFTGDGGASSSSGASGSSSGHAGSSSGSSGSSSGVSSSGSSSGSSGDDGGGVTDAQCQMMTGMAADGNTNCADCCLTNHKMGAATFFGARDACICSAEGGMGVCQTQCATELCAAMPKSSVMGDACYNCVDMALGGMDAAMPACVMAVDTACMADPDCLALFGNTGCLSGCP
jgi:hypothetical protein